MDHQGTRRTDLSTGRLSNLGITGVLDLAGSRHDAGAPILLYPQYRSVPRNQGWYLQYMKKYVA